MKFIATLVIFFQLPITANSQPDAIEPVWSISLSNENAKIGEMIDLIFDVKLDSTWFLFSTEQSVCKDSMLVVSVPIFQFKKNMSYEIVGKINPINAEILQEDFTKCFVSYFKFKAQFKQKIKILSNPLKVSGDVFYVVFDFNGNYQFIPYVWNWTYGAKQ